MRASLIDAMRKAAGPGLLALSAINPASRGATGFSDIVDKLSAAHHMHPADRRYSADGHFRPAYVRCRAAPRKPRGCSCREDALETDTQWAKWQIVTQSADGRYIWTERLDGLAKICVAPHKPDTTHKT